MVLLLCLLWGAIFGEIGKRLPIFNKYIGGAPIYDISGLQLILSMLAYLREKKFGAISNMWIKQLP